MKLVVIAPVRAGDTERYSFDDYNIIENVILETPHPTK